MSRIPDIKRIRVEDFKKEDQDMISKIAYSFNTFADQVINVFNKNVDFDNLNRQLIEVQVELDGTGAVVNPPKAKFNLRNGKISGISVVSAVNTQDPSIYPTNSPFVSYTFTNGLLSVVNVTGLQVSSKYKLTLELIG